MSSSLQEVLAVLLGTEAEAKRILQDSKTEAGSFLQEAQDKFTKDRTLQIGHARQRADEIMQTAVNDSKTEAAQIAEIGKTERDSLTETFKKGIDPLIDALVSEVAESYKKKAKI